MNEQFTFKVTQQELDVIFAGLYELQVKHAMPVINSLAQQLEKAKGQPLAE